MCPGPSTAWSTRSTSAPASSPRSTTTPARGSRSALRAGSSPSYAPLSSPHRDRAPGRLRARQLIRAEIHRRHAHLAVDIERGEAGEVRDVDFVEHAAVALETKIAIRFVAEARIGVEVRRRG